MGVIVDHDPFASQPAPRKGAGPVIVDHDPFAAQPAPKNSSGPVVVDHDPFASPKPTASTAPAPAPAKKSYADQIPKGGLDDVNFDPIGALKAVASDYVHAPQTAFDDVKGSLRQVGRDLKDAGGAQWNPKTRKLETPDRLKGPVGWARQQAGLPRAVADAAGAIPGAMGDALFAKPMSDLTQLPRDKLNMDLMAIAPEKTGPVKPTVLGGAARATGRLAARSETVQQTARVARELGSSVKTWIAPTTASDKAARTGRIIRGARATLDTQKEVTAHDLVGFNSDVAHMTVEQQRALAGYIENRSKGGLPPDVLPEKGEAALSERGKRYAAARGRTSTMRQVADRIADNYQRYRALVGKHVRGSNVDAFVDDYYAHLWKEKPTIVKEKLGQAPRQGSGRNLRQRTIPTIEDGIRAGLTPKFENPVEATMAYAQNMSRFLSTHATLNELRDLGYARHFVPGKQPEGWVPLNGILTERAPPPPARFQRSKAPGGPGRPIEVPGDPRLGGPGETPQIGAPGPRQLEGVGAEAPGRIGRGEPGLTVGLNDAEPQIGHQPGAQARLSGEEPLRLTDAAAGARKVFTDPVDKPLPERDAPPRVNEKLFAPADVARVYNRSISPGHNGPLYEATRAASNGLKAFKLGLSPFHAVAMTLEASFSEIARGIQAASRGDLKSAAGAALRSPPGVAAASRYARGLKLERSILEADRDVAPADRKLGELYAKAGGRIGMDPFYNVRKGISFLKSWERGTLGVELRQAIKNATTGPLGSRAAGSADLALNVLQSVSEPMFEKMIPRLKRGTWAARMSDWLQANPGASEDQMVAFGSKLMDSIDNRFGEMVMDNVFWSTQAKQIANLMMTSVGWNLGTVRELGGGVVDIPASARGIMKGDGISDRTAYFMALAAGVGVTNAVMTYLKTGEAPQGRDLLAYRTGGTDAATGEPERAVLPSNMKDVLSFAHNAPRGWDGLSQEALNKMGDAPRMAGELVSNSDYRGDPIYSTPDAPLPPTAAGPGGYAAENLTPFAFSQKPQEGTNLSAIERVLGARPAPRYVTAPDVEAAQYRARQRRRAKAAGKHEAQRKAREEGE